MVIENELKLFVEFNLSNCLITWYFKKLYVKLKILNTLKGQFTYDVKNLGIRGISRLCDIVPKSQDFCGFDFFFQVEHNKFL